MFQHGLSEPVKDWTVSAITAGTAIGVSLANLNAILTAVSLLIAIAIGGLRLHRSWRYRHTPPGSSRKSG